MRFSSGLSLLVLIFLSACSEPGQEADARLWLLSNGYEVTMITSSEAGVFEFMAIEGEKRCRGTLNISTGPLGSTSHMRTCSNGATELDLEVECEGGRTQSCHGLGLRRMESDPAASLTFFVRACEGGFVPSCTNAGVLSAQSQAPITQAMSYARRGCAGGDPLGCDNLGIYLLRRPPADVNEADKTEGRRLLEEGCTRGSATSCGILGWHLSFGPLLPHDEVRARALLTQACEAEAWGPCGDLGLLFRDGRGGPRDVEEALRYSTMACTGAGLAVSCGVQGGFLSERQPGAFSAEALAAFQRGCASTERTPHVGAVCNMAGRYLFQMGNPPNAEPVAALLGRACELENSDGCHNLGMLHASSRFGPANMSLAREFMQRACQLGRQESCRLARQ
ncbi:MAG: tetratricopeptide repeat protein [Polyangiales bacterium]